MDLRRLGHFIAVVEAAGFTSAAGRLHVSQQALSSSVRQLEKEVGTPLLVRSGRRIRPTPAGQTLFAEGRALLAAANTVAQHTLAAAGTEPNEFVVGHSPAISGSDVYRLLEPAILASPETPFTVVRAFPGRLNDDVRDGAVHLGLRRGVVPQEQLAGTVIGYDPLRIAVRAGHRLADRTRVGIGELSDEPIVLWSPPGMSYYSDFLVNACRRAGFEPRYRVSRVQGCPPEAAALTDDAVAFVTCEAGQRLGGAVTVLDLDEPLLVPIQAFWQLHTHSAVRDLILDGGVRQPERPR